MRTHIGRLFLVGMCTLGSGAAFASPETDIRACSAESDSVKRLACFDDVAQQLNGKADEVVRNALGNPATPTNWIQQIDQSKIDESVGVMLATRALSSFAAKFKTHTPLLVLRCLESTTSLYIDFDGAFVADTGGFGDVTVRMDKAKATTLSMAASTDNTALGLWRGTRSIPVIKQMLGRERMVVRAVPYSESPATFEFDISGLDKAIEPLQKACKW